MMFSTEEILNAELRITKSFEIHNSIMAPTALVISYQLISKSVSLILETDPLFHSLTV